MKERQPSDQKKARKFLFWESAPKCDASSLEWDKKIGVWHVIFVIFALGVLSALFHPAVTSYIDPEGVGEAKNDVTQYATAMRAYVTEYGKYPAGGAARNLKALRGENPRKLVFLEVDEKKVSAQGFLVDPWRTPYLVWVKDWKPWAYSCGKNRVDEHGKGDDVTSWD